MASADAFSSDLAIFKHLGETAEGRAWLQTLPSMVAALEAEWSIQTGTPYRSGVAGWAAPATLGDDRPAVLKVGWPHPEAREEGSALVRWGGLGAVELYEEDRASWGLLMERCQPGVPLGESNLSPGAAITAAAGLLVSLWRVQPLDPSPFDRLVDVTKQWADQVRTRMNELHPPYDAGLVEMGAGLLESLPRAAQRDVLLHGDFNPGNILSSGRQGWATIDPKPMIGDPAYDPAPLLLQIDPPFEQPDPARVLWQRAARLAGLVGEPSVRILAWTAARSVESALWFASRGHIAEGLTDLEVARVCARLTGD